MVSVVNAFWYVSSNFGDMLTPWLLHALGKTPCYVPKDSPTPKIIMSGSILSEADGSATVWGAGIGSVDQTVNPSAAIRAVRGPISLLKAQAAGVSCPAVYGDPGLLMPRFYSPVEHREPVIGLFPHFVDQERVFPCYAGKEEFSLIDILGPVEKTIEAVTSCDLIVSSALHGCILAIAYQVPFVWVRFSDRVLGGDTKFFDFFSSVNLSIEVMDLRGPELPSAADFRRRAIAPPAYNVEPFWNLRPECLY